METENGDLETNHVSIEITSPNDSLVTTIKNQMETVVAARCIDRVNVAIREGYQKAYIPDKISIGPLHHGQGNLKATEDHKWRYLYALLNRKPSLESTLHNCVQAVKDLEHKARLCYEEMITLPSDEFVKLLLVDGGFIIELFLRHAIKGLKRRNDPIFSTPGLVFDLRCNMILLENQIPLFILQRLYQIIPIPEQCNLPLTNLAFHFFRNMIPGDHSIHREKFSLEGNHLLDLIRHCFLPTFPRVKVTQDAQQTGLQSAKKLKHAGIQVKKAKTENLLDVKFVDGVLEIPPIQFHQYTESLLRNLIAFEQCPCDNTQHISSYVILMKSLIFSRKDVKFLKKRHILINFDPSEEEVFDLFDRLSKAVNPSDLKDFCFDGLCEQVNEYITSSSHRAWGKKKKSKHQKERGRLPEMSRLFVIAILLLVLTFAGALFSVLSFFLRH